MGRVYERGGYWYVDYNYRGKRIRQKGAPGKKQAQAKLRQIENAIADGSYGEKKILFEDFIDDYLSYSAVRKKRSLARDITSTNNLIKFFRGRFIDEITVKDIENYKDSRIDKISEASINREISCLKHMLFLAVKWDYIKENPCKQVKLFREEQRLRYLEVEENPKLINACCEHLNPIVKIDLNTGMRKDEILGLTWDRIDFKNERITLNNTKNGDRRDIPMNKTVLETLKAIPRHIKSPYVFCDGQGNRFGNIRRSFETAKKRSGIFGQPLPERLKDFRFHDLRHTFASQLIMNGASLISVSKLLGHKNLDMTLRYAHLSPDYLRQEVAILDKINGNLLAQSKVRENEQAGNA